MQKYLNVPKLPLRGHYTSEAQHERVTFLENFCSINLDFLRETNLQASELKGNIESYIGTIQLPLGIVGPVFLTGIETTGSWVFIPMATNEGALISSVNRGGYALSRCGGIESRFIRQIMVRAPLFTHSCLSDAVKFVQWIKSYFENLVELSSKYSNHARLIKIDPLIMGRDVHLRFEFETADAAGQNMTTICTWQCCSLILKQYPKDTGKTIEHFYLESNGSSDKKISFMNILKGRGCEVAVEGFIDRKTCLRILKVKPEDLFDFYLRAQSISKLGGTFGYETNISNAVAGIFAACGQDLASIGESSFGIINMELMNGGVYISLLMKNLVIGTIGGGTGHPEAKKCLEIMGCYGTDKVKRFAQIIASAALSLELSTSSALASGQFAHAHERLGRNRPIQWLTAAELNEDFLNSIFFRSGKTIKIEKKELKAIKGLSIGEPLRNVNSIITRISSSFSRKTLGFFPLKVDFIDKSGILIEGKELIVKLKPLDHEVMIALEIVASQCDENIYQLIKGKMSFFGFKNCHTRELFFYAERFPNIQDLLPQYYAHHIEPDREIFLLIIENFHQRSILLEESENCPRYWTNEMVEIALRGIARIHIHFSDAKNKSKISTWAERSIDLESLIQLVPFFKETSRFILENYYDSIDSNAVALYQKVFEEINFWWKIKEDYPKTLVHNDFNPRNLVIHRSEGGIKPLFYDWELSCLNIPHRDVVEFLSFMDDLDEQTITQHINYYTSYLKGSDLELSVEEHRNAFLIAAKEFLLMRVSLYAIAHQIYDYPFFFRMFKNTIKLIVYFDNF